MAVPQLKDLELSRDERGVPHLRGLYEHWRANAGWQTEDQFSDGTLRLMGLLWVLLDGTEPLLLEEPELSLHPEVVRFIPAIMARLGRKAGRQVLVDFTAKWCLTCQANKKFALEIPSVRAKLKQVNAVALLGDYTRFPADITDELNRFQRAGVPLVLVYPRDASQPPLLLPEALTPGIVLDALEKASK